MLKKKNSMERFRINRVKRKQILQDFLPFVLIYLVDEYLKESFLITIGGYSWMRNSIATCNIFNNENNQWEYFSTLPKEIWGAFLIQVNTKLFVIGGFNSFSCYECDLYDTKVMIWEEKAKMSLVRATPFGFHFKDSIYIFGGFNRPESKEDKNRNRLVSGEKYNMKTNQWITLSSQLPCEEFFLSVAIIKTFEKNQSIYAFAHKNPKQFQAEYNILLDHWDPIILSEADFQSSTYICFTSPSGIYFNYPYIYTTNNRRGPEVLLYKIFGKIIPEESYCWSYRSKYYITILPNKTNIGKESDSLVLDSDGILYVIYRLFHAKSDCFFAKWIIQRRKCSCIWIDI